MFYIVFIYNIIIIIELKDTLLSKPAIQAYDYSEIGPSTQAFGKAVQSTSFNEHVVSDKYVIYNSYFNKSFTSYYTYYILFFLMMH